MPWQCSPTQVYWKYVFRKFCNSMGECGASGLLIQVKPQLWYMSQDNPIGLGLPKKLTLPQLFLLVPQLDP